MFTYLFIYYQPPQPPLPNQVRARTNLNQSWPASYCEWVLIPTLKCHRKACNLNLGWVPTRGRLFCLMNKLSNYPAAGAPL